ncbi:hypothetical protein MMC22_010409 [Lobaria immixta]|nr:hypothetical protein [Lobaria immixta]
MGGKAFANELPKLPTPRMPPSVYFHFRQKCLSVLSALYVHVASPADCPEKSSHGDIDILVSSPLDPAHPPTPAVLATTLCAVKTINSGPVKSFAVPYPDEPGKFVQVDVKVCGPALFDWELFHNSYGDLWNILGTSIRSFGLTVNHRGLHVRIREIEAVERKQSLLFLTCEPDAVLRFVGLDLAEYRDGWTRVEDMFAFLVRSRFSTKEAYVRRELKANDRKRMAGREIYRRFVEDWMPVWDDGRGRGGSVYPPKEGEDDEEWEETRKPRRTAVLQEALNRFGKQAEYDAKVAEWKAKRKQWLGKSEGREDRKIRAVEEAEYADAWIDYLKSSSSTKQGSIPLPTG